MKFRAIPQVPIGVDPQTKAFLAALKENFEILAGMRGGSGNPVADLLGYTPVNKAGDTVDGNLVLNRPVFYGSLGVPVANSIHPIIQVFQSGFAIETNKITVVTPGRYWFGAQQLIDPNGACYMALRKNGSTVVYGYNTGTIQDMGTHFVADMVAGDYFDMYWQGNTPNNAWGGAHSTCSIFMVG